MRKKRQEIVTITRVPGIPFIRVVSGHAVVNDFARHIHDDLCVGAITSGRRVMTVGDATIDLSAGDLFIVNPGQPHQCDASHAEAHSYSVIVIDAGFLAQIGSAGIVFGNFIAGDAELYRRMMRLVELLLSDESLIEKEGALYSFIDVLIRTCASSKADEGICVMPEAVSRVREYIDEHYAQQLSLEELSSVAGLSPFHLNRLFCAEVGMAPHAYQMHRRIERSKRMLREHHPIADTALEMGFADQSHFSKFFRRIVGTTPANFVKWNS